MRIGFVALVAALPLAAGDLHTFPPSGGAKTELFDSAAFAVTLQGIVNGAGPVLPAVPATLNVATTLAGVLHPHG